MYTIKTEMNTRDGNNVMKREECYYVVGPTGNRLSPCLPTLIAARHFQDSQRNLHSDTEGSSQRNGSGNPTAGLDGASGGSIGGSVGH